MSRVRREISFTYPEGIRWLTKLPKRDRWPLSAWICRAGKGPRSRSSRGIEPEKGVGWAARVEIRARPVDDPSQVRTKLSAGEEGLRTLGPRRGPTVVGITPPTAPTFFGAVAEYWNWRIFQSWRATPRLALGPDDEGRVTGDADFGGLAACALDSSRFRASRSPRTILIDEPNIFLHSGAIRKLIEIMRTDPIGHQTSSQRTRPRLFVLVMPSACIWWSGKKSKVSYMVLVPLR